MNKEETLQMEQLADSFATINNSAYTNDYYGFIEGYKKAFSLNIVSQQRGLLELVTEIANSNQVYSNTRHKLWAKKLISSNCG